MSRQLSAGASTPRDNYDLLVGADQMDIPRIWTALADTYWAKGISEDLVRRSVCGSDCYGFEYAGFQIAFARVISDGATFAYLCDVIVWPKHRGLGVGKALLALILEQPRYAGIRRWVLATRDAHPLYEQFGFRALRAPDTFMEIFDPEIYTRDPDQ